MPSLPKVKIPVHVFAFSVACAPGIAYAYYYSKNVKSDEEFEKILSENYGSKIQASRDKRADIARVVQSVQKPGSDAEMEQKMKGVLYAGKSEAKRHYAVDESLYGTREGERKRQAAEEEQARRKEEKKAGAAARAKSSAARSKKNKKQVADVDGDATNAAAAGGSKGEVAMGSTDGTRSTSGAEDNDRALSEQQSESLLSSSSGYKKSAVGLAAVGALAAGVGLLFGGSRSQ